MTADDIYNASTLVLAAIYLGLMILSAAQGLLSPLFRRFFVLNLSLFIWNIGLYLGVREQDSLFAFGLSTGGILLFCFALIDFSHRFFGFRGRWSRYLSTAIGSFSFVGMLALVIVLALVQADALAERPSRSAFDYWTNSFSIGALGYCMILSIITMATTSSARFRNRLYFMTAAIVVGFLAATTNLAATIVGHPDFPASRIGMIIATGIAAYAIVRRRMLNFEIAMRRCLTGVFYTVICLAGASFLAERSAYVGDFSRQILFLSAIALALLIWILPPRFLGGLTERLQRLVYPERFGALRAQIDFSIHAARFLDRRSLAQGIFKATSLMAPFKKTQVAFCTADGQWSVYESLLATRQQEIELYPVALTEGIKAFIDWTSGGNETVIVEDLERTRDRMRPEAPERKALDNFAHACQTEEMDLAVGAAEESGPRVLLLFTYSTNRQSLASQTLAALEALAAESLTVLHRLELLEQVRKSERLAALGEMASSIAHEIKNPLSAIRGAAQAMQNSPGENGDPELAAIIAEETIRLDGLVNDFLDFSRDTRLDLASTCLNSLVEKTLRLCSLRADFGEIEISVEADKDLPDLQADEEKLHQCLLNLLGNAAEAMDKKGAIAIHIKGKGDCQTLAVIDNGPGVSEKARERLFEPFFTTKPQGAGLGLAICRKIIEAHGGQLDYRPVEETTTGSVFEIRLPQ